MLVLRPRSHARAPAALLAGGLRLAALDAPRRPPAGRTHSPQPHLDAKYTVFGHVVAGMDVVDKLQQDDTIVRIRIWDGSVAPPTPAPPTR